MKIIMETVVGMMLSLGASFGFADMLYFFIKGKTLLEAKAEKEIADIRTEVEINEENCMNTFEWLMDLEKEVEHLKKVINLRNVEF